MTKSRVVAARNGTKLPALGKGCRVNQSFMVNRVAIGAEVGPHAPLSTSLGMTTEIRAVSGKDRAGDDAAMRVLIVGRTTSRWRGR